MADICKMDFANLKPITDKDLIVFLVAINHEIKAIRSDLIHSRSLVYFDKTEAIDKAILDFTNKSAVINISDYIAADRRVTTLLCLQKTS